jgi:hypothetical protein
MKNEKIIERFKRRATRMAEKSRMKGSRFYNNTYEEGIEHALRWALDERCPCGGQDPECQHHPLQ